jgi:hypothetical protein
MPSIGKEISIQAQQLPFLGYSNLPTAEKGMTLPCGNNILVTIEHTANRPFSFHSSCCADTGQLNGSSFLSSKSPTQPFHLANNLVRCDPGDLRDDSLTSTTP